MAADAAKPAATKSAAKGRTPARALSARVSRDHKAIAEMADQLLPALIAKLTASNLGEIEVREGPVKARLRKPAGVGRGAIPPHSHESVAAHMHGAAARTSVEESRARTDPEAEEMPIMALSPAVGVFYPRKDLAVGMQVRAGERMGAVDVLGVREDVVAPVDGIVGSSLAESGEAVEYGQGLIKIELPEKTRSLTANGADREAAAVLGEA